MNTIGVLAVQLDRTLKNKFRDFCKNAEGNLGRAVCESEAARVLLRRALDGKVSLGDVGYEEGFRAGMAAAKAAFAAGVDAATKAVATPSGGKVEK